jgi:hypothetical protein
MFILCPHLEDHETLELIDYSRSDDAPNLIRPQKVLPFDIDDSSDEQTVRKNCISSPSNGAKKYQSSPQVNKKTVFEKVNDIIEEVSSVYPDSQTQFIFEPSIPIVLGDHIIRGTLHNR